MTEKQKAGRYQRMYDQLIPLFEKNNNPFSRMASIVALLHHKIDYYFWTGFYLLDGKELQVAVYQGPLACMTLENSKGVCWAGINQRQTIIVPNVHDFPGHIACDSRSNSEIVVPLFNHQNDIIGVLDVDSTELNSFSEADKLGLEKLLTLIYS